jgi:hypothetical protein
MPDWTVCAGHPCVAIKPRNRIDLVAVSPAENAIAN